jgi:carbamoyltransferase
MVDGRVLACVSEERLSRRKNDDVYPKLAIERCLAVAGLRSADLDVVAIAGERFDPKYVLCHRYGYSVQDRLREQRDYWYPRMYEHRDVNYLDVFQDKLDLEQYPGRWDEVIAFLRDRPDAGAEEANAFFQRFRRDTVCGHLGIDAERVVFTHHHRTHTYYSYFGSPGSTESTLVLAADAFGDDMNAQVSLAEGGAIRVLSTSDRFNVARLYRSMTLLLGMKPDEHEYKLMGLAAYSKPQYYQGPLDVFRETMYVDGMGFAYRVTPPDLYVHFQQRLEGYRFDAIAGGLQRYAEEILTEWTRNCVTESQSRRVCFGGGVAMNVKAMMEIAKLPGVDVLSVCPSPGDESLAIGACYVAMHDSLEGGENARKRLRPLDNAYLGPDLTADDIREAAEAMAAEGYRVREQAGPSVIAGALAAGSIVGRCAGRSEFGARALGNRSILADPRDPGVVRRINEKVKSRDFWMPFAPSVLEEHAASYLVNPKQMAAPYMTIAFETTPRAHRDLPATLHQADLTARPQICVREANPSYHALITAFEQVSGVGALLNTSFNIHGEPIVQTAADAIDVFRRSDLDALVLGDCFIEKRSIASVD